MHKKTFLTGLVMAIVACLETVSTMTLQRFTTLFGLLTILGIDTKKFEGLQPALEGAGDISKCDIKCTKRMSKGLIAKQKLQQPMPTWEVVDESLPQILAAYIISCHPQERVVLCEIITTVCKAHELDNDAKHLIAQAVHFGHNGKTMPEFLAKYDVPTTGQQIILDTLELLGVDNIAKLPERSIEDEPLARVSA